MADLLLHHRDDGGFSRRRFLGAAGALSTLSVGASSTATTDGGDGDESGGEEDFFTSLELPELHDFDTSYNVHTYENDPNVDVALSRGGDFGGVRMEMTSQRAEQLAKEFLAATQEGDRQ